MRCNLELNLNLADPTALPGAVHHDSLTLAAAGIGGSGAVMGGHTAANAVAKQGRFYSRIYRFVGSWKVEQNTLMIRWDNTNKVEVVRAEKSELQFENNQTKLFVRIQEPKTLPEWFAPECLSKRFEKPPSV